MGMPNRELDASIAAALERGTAITRAQREAAWASLRARAAQQAILAPYAAPPRRQRPHRPLLARMLLAARRGLALTVTDSVRYDRAASRREVFQRCAGPSDRPAFSSSHLVHYYCPSALLRVGLF